MRSTLWLSAAAFIFMSGSAHSADLPIRPRSCDADFPNKILVLPVSDSSKFNVLQNGYRNKSKPNGEYDRDYVPPDTSNSPDARYDTHKSRIVAAYNLASPSFKQRLCSLDYIFIDLNTYPENYPGGWGFWENPLPSGGRHRQGIPGTKPGDWISRNFIGITKAYLDQSPDLRSYEQTIADNLVAQGAVQYSSKGSEAVALLGVMAHEIGHILWVRDGLEQKVRRCPAFKDSWVTPIVRGPNFKKPKDKDPVNPNTSVPHSLDAIIADPSLVDDFFGQTNPTKNENRWASLFAAQHPVEDFAETYRLHMIATSIEAPELSITVPFQLNLAADIANSAQLGEKRECVRTIDDAIGYSAQRQRRRR